MNTSQKLRWVFLGGRPLGVPCLEALKHVGLLPDLVIANPDRPAGRGQVMTPPPEKGWADEHGIPCLQPEKLKTVIDDIRERGPWDVFVLAAYSQILPQRFLDIPRLGIVNLHPSMLPKMRGPSPIRSSILTNAKDAVGVSVMLLDAEMDHGPLIAQKRPVLSEWPMRGSVLDALLITEGSQLLAETLPQYCAGEILPQQQDHSKATICSFFEKGDARIDLQADAYTNLLKICAYDGWPGAFTTVERNGKEVRIKIITAHIEDDTLILDRIVPEGKSEMLYSDFVRGS
ncbi:MAG: hypothetical protein RI911_65 [Candidatus Parcubacteria bacterium]|jgi:methionyl-tRNA formyltransferase